MTTEVERYWDGTLEELAGYPAKPEVELMPIRSTDFATLYSVRLTSIGPYQAVWLSEHSAGRGALPCDLLYAEVPERT